MTDQLATPSPHRPLSRVFLRPFGNGEVARVSNVELFFDLVFVYAVTQVSHLILKGTDTIALAQASVLLLAVWSGWIATAWSTNRLNPDDVVVRVLLFVLMALGLIQAMALPAAFGARGLVFAVTYSLFQLVRSGSVVLILRPAQDAPSLNAFRIFIWFLLAAPFWIGGGVAQDGTRLLLWSLALVIEYGGPLVGFYLPGHGRSAIGQWNVEGGHIAERCSLFIIIALGESLIMAGTALEAIAWNGATISAFAVSFVSVIALWWIYFDSAMERASEHIRSAANPALMARTAYSYLHLPIVGGIILIAVAQEKIIAHPHSHADLATFTVLIGGPIVMLLGNIGFKVSFRRLPFSHLLGLALIGLIGWFGVSWSLLTLGLALTGALVFVALWESLSLRGMMRW
jgi:low temperature requirement protein LtrA